MTVSPGTLLGQLFAAAGNPLHPTAAGFKTGHEPVHRSESGQCVAIEADQERWFCHSCQQGGDLIKAVMSLKGVSREDAEAYLRELTGETSKSDTSMRPKTSQATALVQLAEKPPRFSTTLLSRPTGASPSASTMRSGRHARPGFAGGSCANITSLTRRCRTRMR
jgi:hypothetical protein